MEQRTRWLPWVVAGLTLFVFLPAVGNDFVNWDDDRNFLENPYYRGLSIENIRWMFTTFHLGHYHPLTWLSLGLDYVLWEMNPAGYHFTNIVLHTATALLVYFLILRLLGLATQAEEETAELRFSAAFGALLFAVHPLRVESVAWVSERRDVLSGLFCVAAALLYLRGRLAASVGLFAAALMSKVIVASLPVVLLLVDIYPLRKKPSFGLLLNKIPYFALALAAGLFALSRQRTGVGGTFADIAVEPVLRVTMSLYGLAFYAWKTVLPFGLAPQYVLGSSPGAFDLPLLVGSLAAIAVTAAAVFCVAQVARRGGRVGLLRGDAASGPFDPAVRPAAIRWRPPFLPGHACSSRAGGGVVFEILLAGPGSRRGGLCCCRDAVFLRENHCADRHLAKLGDAVGAHSDR